MNAAEREREVFVCSVHSLCRVVIICSIPVLKAINNACRKTHIC